jgi:putative endonuclease
MNFFVILNWFADDLRRPFYIGLMAKFYFVYIIECLDGAYYTGVTNDIERRLVEHNEGNHPKSFTYSRRPVTLKYCERFIDIRKAIDWEKQLKGWSRKKKEALFKQDWDEIVRLSNLKRSSIGSD